MQVQHMDIPYNTIGEFTMLILKRFTCTVKKAKKSTFFKVDFLFSFSKCFLFGKQSGSFNYAKVKLILSYLL